MPWGSGTKIGTERSEQLFFLHIIRLLYMCKSAPICFSRYLENRLSDLRETLPKGPDF